MLASMTAAQFREWQEFYNLEPWGFLIEERRAALTPMMLGNVYRDRKKRSRPFKETDFMFDTRTEQEKTTGQIRMLEAQHAAKEMVQRAEELARTMRPKPNNGGIE